VHRRPRASGSGFAACTQPHDAQLPHDTIALGVLGDVAQLLDERAPAGMQ